jgi:hypothetical protein
MDPQENQKANPMGRLLSFSALVGKRVHIKLAGEMALGSRVSDETVSTLRELDAKLLGVEAFGLWLESPAFRPVYQEGIQETRWEAQLEGETPAIPLDFDFPVFLPFPMIFMVIPRDDPA